MATLPNDPLFGDQWHLQNNTPGELDLNLVDVWDDYTGAGVDVAIIDDAVQRNHPDLDGNYSTAKDWDFANNDTNPSGAASDGHGTAVAGIIGANANNGIGGVGIAHGSTIFGFQTYNWISNRFIGDLTAAIDNASGVRQQSGINREADVVNMSLGTMFRENYFDQALSSSAMTELNQAIDNSAVLGRDGLGTILVKSAGNSREINHDTNASSWNANPHTISVAAVDRDGFVSSYSTHGASVLVSGFGTPGQVVTTDRTGNEGYNPSRDDGDYISNFNGTSAAAPMVSGVVALMLEANPNLGWRDVQEILAYSARHVGSDIGTGTRGSEEYAWSFNGATNWNGGGLHFSNDYGFGLVDAKAAVRLAETWGQTAQTSANEATVFSDLLNARRTVSQAGSTFSRAISNSIDIEHVEVEIGFSQWDDLGDLEVRLISPDGTSSILIDNSGENDGTSSGGFGSGRWTFVSNAFRGEDTAGTWRVELTDGDSTTISPIVINDIDITFKGQSASINDTLIFTEEYSDYDGTFGHSRNINGGAGNDTINAAAVDSRTTIDLIQGTGSIDGVNITVSGIENVVTGDGNDHLVGNSDANRLVGMRGNDSLYGNSGSDTLLGGAGDDWIDGGFGLDYMDGGSGIDTLDVRFWSGTYELNMQTGITNFTGETAVNFENVYTGSGADHITGNSASNYINTGAGNDRIEAGSGNDWLLGGAGNDELLGDGGNDYLNGTDYSSQGTGERDILTSSSYGDQDTFVLGERQGLGGRVFYNDQANSDYALIRGMDVFDFVGDVADRIQLLGSSVSYSLSNMTVDGVFGTGIRFGGDLIGLVAGVNSSSLSLSNSNHFIYV
ncbi:MAG: S8 family serine peptidase [Synechococcales cyanobacterium RM1_1_8]|nr:S8 family serine peptidase [Synechococcales cyanobacterium RM1_1_8]